MCVAESLAKFVVVTQHVVVAVVVEAELAACPTMNDNPAERFRMGMLKDLAIGRNQVVLASDLVEQRNAEIAVTAMMRNFELFRDDEHTCCGDSFCSVQAMLIKPIIRAMLRSFHVSPKH